MKITFFSFLALLLFPITTFSINYGRSDQTDRKTFVTNLRDCEKRTIEKFSDKILPDPQSALQACLTERGYINPAGWGWWIFLDDATECEIKTGQNKRYLFTGDSKDHLYVKPNAEDESTPHDALNQCMRERGHADPEGWIRSQCRKCRTPAPWDEKFVSDEKACERETGEPSDRGPSRPASLAFRRCMNGRGYGSTGGP